MDFLEALELKVLKDEKAQTSVEYLLILGGAVAAATAVGLYIKSIPKTASSSIEQGIKEATK